VCGCAVPCSSFRCWPVGRCELGSYASVGGLMAMCWAILFNVSVACVWLIYWGDFEDFGEKSSHLKSPMVS
jgi:hypothetical protein